VGKLTELTCFKWNIALILMLAVAAGTGCGPRQLATVDEAPPANQTQPGDTPEAPQVPETPEAPARPDTATPAAGGEAAPGPELSEEEVSALFQEAKNLYQLGQETITSGDDAEKGRDILAQAAELYLQIIECGAQTSMRSEALLDYITTKDYFARHSRDVEGDIPAAIAHYNDVIEAIGDNINSQKQFYYLVTADLYRFEQNDAAAARDLYRKALDYCQGIEPGNFSSCSDWEMLQIRHSLDVLGRELDGDDWGGFTNQTLSLPNRDFENYYLLAAGLLDSAEMDPAIWSKETGYSDEFYVTVTNRKTLLDVILINCFHGETLAAKDPVLGDGIREKNFQRLLESFPEHPATMIMLVKQSVHARKMLRPEEADTYFAMAEDLARGMNITLIVDLEAPPVQEFLRREYPADREAAAGDPAVTEGE